MSFLDVGLFKSIVELNIMHIEVFDSSIASHFHLFRTIGHLGSLCFQTGGGYGGSHFYDSCSVIALRTEAPWSGRIFDAQTRWTEAFFALVCASKI